MGITFRFELRKELYTSSKNDNVDISEIINGIFNKPEFMLAERLVLLQFGEFRKSLQDSYFEIIIPLPNFACQLPSMPITPEPFILEADINSEETYPGHGGACFSAAELSELPAFAPAPCVSALSHGSLQFCSQIFSPRPAF